MSWRDIFKTALVVIALLVAIVVVVSLGALIAFGSPTPTACVQVENGATICGSYLQATP